MGVIPWPNRAVHALFGADQTRAQISAVERPCAFKMRHAFRNNG